MADLGTGQKPDIMPHYPHFLTEDTEVWSKFLKTDGERLKRVWYDVRVGLSVLEGTEASETERRIAAGLTRKRIDVVASVGGGYWVIEVKPYANYVALGQALTYARLLGSEYKLDGEVIPVIVCDEYDVDMVDGFDQYGILVLKND